MKTIEAVQVEEKQRACETHFTQMNTPFLAFNNIHVYS